jgi:hypothetical protein
MRDVEIMHGIDKLPFKVMNPNQAHYAAFAQSEPQRERMRSA